ncbi:hypothetical protein [Priestia filamentosa]|nr:hypothetical protein [Priestia filamentosa]
MIEKKGTWIPFEKVKNITTAGFLRSFVVTENTTKTSINNLPFLVLVIALR